MQPNIQHQKTEEKFSTWIEIKKSHLISNTTALRAQAAPFADIMAVIKANAYGHGLIPIAKSLEESVPFFAVSAIREARELRAREFNTPILLMGRVLPEDVKDVLEIPNLAVTISHYSEAEDFSKACLKANKKIKVHIKVDSGMGRLGIPFYKAISEIEKMALLPGLQLEGIYTHFPVADEEEGFTQKQAQDFALLIQALDKKGISFEFRHAANSAGSMRIKSPVFNLIRPGIMLYGIYPHFDFRSTIDLKPVLSLKSRIISLKRITAGNSVGYARSFVAESNTTIALLPVGYSHGYPFRLSGKSWIIYKEKKYPVVGRISMDYIAFDLGDDAGVIGDAATVIGAEGNVSIRVEDLAEWSGTIPYEIVTRLQADLPRIVT